MSTIKINGNTYSGNNIVVTNGKVIINGKDVTPESKEINISVEGNIDELKIDVEITGDVDGNIQTMSGDIDCGHVQGSIYTMSGDVKHRLK